MPEELNVVMVYLMGGSFIFGSMITIFFLVTIDMINNYRKDDKNDKK